MKTRSDLREAKASASSWQPLSRFWFEPAPAARLAMLRILIGLYVLVYNALQQRIYRNSSTTGGALFEPVGVVRLLAHPVSPATYQAAFVACLVANVAFILGWQHRYMAPIFAVLLLGIVSYRNSWSMIYHSDNLVVLHVAVLAFVSSADALSLDARRKASRGEPADDWRYGWPLRLICGVTLITYFLAGVAKVAGPLGWSWATIHGLRGQMAVDCLRKEMLGEQCPRLFHLLYPQAWLFAILAPLSLAVELGSPLVIFLSRRRARVWVVAAFMIHWGIFVLMGIVFRYQLSGFAFLAFFDLERIPPTIRRGIQRFQRRPKTA